MSDLQDRLQADLTDAIKGRHELRAATLRMVLAAVKNEAVSGKEARELGDDEVLTVLKRELKKRKEAATAFRDGNREQLAEREEAEAGVIEAYLPAQLSDEELAVLVREAITDAAATGPQQMGQVMKVVSPRVGGLADGGRVAAEVRRQLSALGA